MVLHKVVKECVKDNVRFSLKGNRMCPVSLYCHVLMAYVNEICIGDGLPEDEGLIVHLPDCFMSRVIERLEQFVSGVSRQ